MLHLIFCVCVWAIVFGLIFYRIISGITQGINYVKKIHQIPCSQCAYFTGNYQLKCTINPAIALSESAILCRDFQKSCNCNFNNFQA
jgi:hypothetical protein